MLFFLRECREMLSRVRGHRQAAGRAFQNGLLNPAYTDVDYHSRGRGNEQQQEEEGVSVAHSHLPDKVLGRNQKGEMENENTE